jgi:hypothetical protein
MKRRLAKIQKETLKGQRETAVPGNCEVESIPKVDLRDKVESFGDTGGTERNVSHMAATKPHRTLNIEDLKKPVAKAATPSMTQMRSLKPKEVVTGSSQAETVEHKTKGPGVSSPKCHRSQNRNEQISRRIVMRDGEERVSC